MDNRGQVARGRALFFCLVFPLLTLSGLILVTTSSCARRSPDEASDIAAQSGTAIWGAGDEANVSVPVTEPSNSPKREDVDAETERLRAENSILKEENFWLRTRLIKTQQSLAEANQRIYSLNQKLHAIFKPNSGGE